MQKFYLIIARTALILLPASFICIILNGLLALTRVGMIKVLWQPSWIALTLSLTILLVMVQSESGTSAVEQKERNRTNS